MIMRCYFYLENTFTLIGYMDASPICGEDFCDACGDCLSCYGEDDCVYGGSIFGVSM